MDRDDSGLTIDEHCRGVVVLSVKASDNGTPALSDTTTVKIIFSNLIGVEICRECGNKFYCNARIFHLPD